MKFQLIASLAAILAAATPLTRAEVSITAEYAELFQAGGSPIGTGVVGILVADTGVNPGLADAFNTTLSVGSFLGGSSDDLIVGTFTSISDVGGTGESGFQISLNLTYSENFNAGDNLYLLWFPTITMVGSTVGAGTSFGVYRSSVVNTASGANAAFVAPTNGSSVDMSAFLGAIAPGSPVTVSDFTANFTAAPVPEPHTWELLTVAMLGLGAYCRRVRA